MPAVVLVAMPWEPLASPSLANGTLQQLLGDEGIAAETRSFKLDWMELLLTRQRPSPDPIEFDDYERIASAGLGLGDWVFARPPIGPRGGEPELRALVDDAGLARLWPKLVEMRRLAPELLARCTAELLALDPVVVGFTTTFMQTVPSLALAHQLKRARASLKIVLGGAGCDGPMGAALQRAFPFVDIVVRGEAETTAPRLMRELVAGMAPRPQPGLCFFDGGRQVAVPHVRERAVTMDALPLPDYDEYFARLAATSFEDRLRATVTLPLETVRGCWWGDPWRCGDCNYAGGDAGLRAKSPRRVVDDALALMRRHRVLDVRLVDNVVDCGYLETLLPRLAAAGHDLALLHAIKPGLRKRHVRLLARAGVKRVHARLESLSTPILKLARRGGSALGALRLLKQCHAHGLAVEWSLRFGFPREPPAEYPRMARLFPSLAHLPAPRVEKLRLQRFEALHEHAAELGLAITGPAPWYRHVYDVDDTTLLDLARELDYRHADGRVPEGYAGEWLRAVDAWRDAHAAGASLTYRRGPGFVRVLARRDPARVVELTLVDDEAEVYLACDDGSTVDGICRRTRLEAGRVRQRLAELAAERLVYCEDERFLGLAIAPPGELGGDGDEALDGVGDAACDGGDDGEHARPASAPADPAARAPERPPPRELG
jgi:ribosomal peptide maturation radical SAM protein 1